MTELIIAPHDEDVGTIMSNCDHTVDEGAQEALVNGGVGRYAGWDFYAYVWYDDCKFWAQVMQYRVHVDTLSADTLEDLMEVVSSKWGWE